MNDLNRLRLAETGDPRNRHAHRRLRNGVPHADQRPGADGPVRRNRSRRSICTAPKPGKPSFANNCLLARRLVERGVRFVQLYHTDWDHHGNKGTELGESLDKICREIDQPAAALVKDLKQRGLLDDTLVIWGGEFGRTPHGEPRDMIGRDHHIEAFTMWLAGGGVKPGLSLGQTDEIGYYGIEDDVHVHDLHATILHLLGLDHLKLTFRFQGRDFRLTDVSGNVVQRMLV